MPLGLWGSKGRAVPTRGLRIYVALTVVFLGFIVWRWFHERAMANEARDQAMPACVARLGDEAACRDHLAAYHEDCAHYAHATGSRYAPKKEQIDMIKYVDCVVLGPDAWIAQNKQRREEAERQRQRDLTPP